MVFDFDKSRQSEKKQMNGWKVGSQGRLLRPTPDFEALGEQAPDYREEEESCLGCTSTKDQWKHSDGDNNDAGMKRFSVEEYQPNYESQPAAVSPAIDLGGLRNRNDWTPFHPNAPKTFLAIKGSLSGERGEYTQEMGQTKRTLVVGKVTIAGKERLVFLSGTFYRDFGGPSVVGFQFGLGNVTKADVKGKCCFVQFLKYDLSLRNGKGKQSITEPVTDSTINIEDPTSSKKVDGKRVRIAKLGDWIIDGYSRDINKGDPCYPLPTRESQRYRKTSKKSLSPGFYNVEDYPKPFERYTKNVEKQVNKAKPILQLKVNKFEAKLRAEISQARQRFKQARSKEDMDSIRSEIERLNEVLLGLKKSYIVLVLNVETHLVCNKRRVWGVRFRIVYERSLPVGVWYSKLEVQVVGSPLTPAPEIKKILDVFNIG